MKRAPVNIDLARRQVMAIVNITPDSFYALSRTLAAPEPASEPVPAAAPVPPADSAHPATPAPADIERRIMRAAADGALIIDIGGMSSRPGAGEIDADEEWRRVALGVDAARRLAPAAAVSIDTFRSEIAALAIETFGPLIINDISAGERDPDMLCTAARYDVPYIAMHMRGTPQTMQSHTDYGGDVAGAVVSYFQRRVHRMLAAGIRRERIVLDPGFGFSKTTEQNYELLRGLGRLCALDFPVLAGVSRKSMIYNVLDTDPADALAGSVALGWECLRQGASILRVHDVREAADTIKLFNMYDR